MPDENGIIHYTQEEDQTWQILYDRQIKLLEGLACNEYFAGLIKLDMPTDRVPQPLEISKKLKQLTRWQVEPVPALISFGKFFELLANCKFPAASFIRRREDLDYLKEPDIFHEVFGHCPLLTDPNFAKFTQKVGEVGLGLSREDRALLARLYWFTVEFGLIRQKDGDLKIYGAGIISSKSESVYSLRSDIPQRLEFDIIEVLRTGYRYDELQKVYFIINSFEEMYNILNQNYETAFAKAKELGLKEEAKPNDILVGC